MNAAIPKPVIKEVLREVINEEVANKVGEIECLTARQAAKMLKISESTFRNLKIPHYDFGERSARYAINDIKALLNERRVKA